MRSCLKIIVIVITCLLVSGSSIETTSTTITFSPDPADNVVKQEVIKLKYPVARRDENYVDVYHGTKVPDPYHWLEDPFSEETKEFILAQNNLSFSFFETYPKRQAIHERYEKLWDYPTVFSPEKTGDGKYYFYKNNGLQNQGVLYVQETLDAEPKVILDANTFSDDGTVAVKQGKFSQDGSVYAYALSANGSDWETIHFIDTKTGKNYPEVLKKVKWSSISWTHDNRGIFYSSFCDYNGKMDGTENVIDVNHKLCYHKIGTPQDEDIVVVDAPEKPFIKIEGIVTDCGRWLIISMWEGNDDNLIYFAKLNSEITGKLSLTKVIEEFGSEYEYVGNVKTKSIFKTNKDAPNYKLMTIDLENFEENGWLDLIGEDSSSVLDLVKLVDGNKLAVCYLKDVKSVLKIYDIETREFIWQPPLEIGTISEFFGDKRFSEIIYGFTNYLTPGIIYKTDLKQKEKSIEVFDEAQIKGFNASLYEVNQVFYSSKDGTQIPMFIIFSKNLELNGSTACLLYGYGGFNINIKPEFDVSFAAFLKYFEGIVAVPNIRGGGEYGSKWHDSGRLFNKQNVFDDFQSAAEYLIDNKYTSSEKLTIYGGSNGGLLVAACANQRPDLFGAVIAVVGVMDMLKFPKFTIGNSWISEYGSPDDPKDFENLIKYSPLHNVRPPADGGQYPAMLLLTADHDDRVVPSHSLKLIATLQHVLENLPQQKNPLLLRTDFKSGHGEGKPASKHIEESTDILSFIAHSLNIDFKEKLI